MSNNIAVVASNAWYIFNFRKDLILDLSKKFDFVYIYVGFDGYEQYLKGLGGNICVVDSNLDRKSTTLLSNIRLLYFYFRQYIFSKPSIVLNFTIKPNVFSGLICIFLNIPFINNVTGLGTVFISKGLLQRFVTILYKFIFPFARYVIFQNNDDLEMLSRLGVKSKNFELIEGSGVNLDVNDPGENLTSDRYYDFVFIGRLLKDKGIVEFITACKSLLSEKKLNIAIVGGFDTQNKSAITKKDFDLLISDTNIKYLGFSNDVKGNLLDAKCIVLPSYREGLSRVLIEAASMKCCIIASDVPGCRQVVSNNNGYLVKAFSSNELLTAMRKFSNLDEDVVNDMGRAGRELVEKRFSIDIINNEVISLIN